MIQNAKTKPSQSQHCNQHKVPNSKIKNVQTILSHRVTLC
jgi:hypothetical protein